MKKMLMALLLTIVCLSYAVTFQAVPTHSTVKKSEVKEVTVVHYDGDNFNSIGTGGAYTFEVAIRLTPTELLNHYGKQLKKIQLWVHSETYSQVTLKVYEGATATTTGTLLCSQVVPNVVPNLISDYELTTPVNLEYGKEYWVGYEVVATDGYPAGCDAGPVTAEGKSNLIKIEGVWTTLTAVGGLAANFNIRAVVDGTAPSEDVNPPICVTPTGTTVTPGCAMSISTNVVDATGIASVVGHYQLTGQTNWTDFPMTVLKATGTYTGTIPAQPAAITGKVKFTATDTVTPTANSGDSPETFIEWNTELNYDFETGIPEGWTILDADGDSFNWGVENLESSAHGGTYAFCSASYMNDKNKGPLTPDNFLITQQANVAADATVKFWVSALDAAYPAEHYGVGISTTGTAAADFTMLYEETMVDDVWYERTVNIPPSYIGKNVYLAFRHFNCTDMFWLNLDDVTLTNFVAPVGIDDNQAKPVAATLNQNYPNPFNPTTTINFFTNTTGDVKLTVLNAKGEIVTTLINKSIVAGNHSVNFDGARFNSGVYFYKLETPTAVITKKMLLVK